MPLLFLLLLLLASLTSSSSKGTSVQDPHNRELHGASTRRLLERMAAAGDSHITDNDVGVLFLRCGLNHSSISCFPIVLGAIDDIYMSHTPRHNVIRKDRTGFRQVECPSSFDTLGNVRVHRYQREFNRSYRGSGELSRALAGFTESARTIAKLRDPAVEFGVNEVSDMSAADWVASWKGGARRIRVPFAQQNMGQEGAKVDSRIDWRDSLVPPYILQPPRSPIFPGTIHGQLAALGGCLDALILREASNGAPPLPHGGFGHIASHHAPLAAALTPSPDSASPFPSGVVLARGGGTSGGSVGADAAAPASDALPRHLRLKLEKKRRGEGGDFKHVPFSPGPGHADEGACASWDGWGVQEGWGEALEWALGGGVEFRGVAHGDELMLQRALERGPVAVSFDASDPRLQHYRSGVYGGWEGCSKRGSTHGFLLVAQGADGGGRYWVLKSSLGRSWGEGGYLRVRMGGNICGIATAAVYAANKGDADY